MLRRREATQSLVAFAQQIDIPGKPLTEHSKEDRFGVIESPLVAHHRLICEAIQQCIGTPGGRMMGFLPPGAAKSTYCSVVGPTWAMGRRPRYQVILTSYADELAIKHSRKARQIVGSRRYREIFDTGLGGGQTAADQWKLDNESEYMASGILAGLTGNRGDLLVVDDPLRGREAAESQTQRDKVWDAYQDDARSRLKPGGSRIMLLCMTGDTPVLMADGSETPLRDIRAGDQVATYDDGVITTSKVLNWRSCGHDSVYEIMMKSGISVRANERHPFLVNRGGIHQWVRLGNLVTGDQICRVVSGKASYAGSSDVTRQPSAKATAWSTTKRSDGPLGTDRHPSMPNLAELSGLSVGTASASMTITPWSGLKVAYALFVSSLRAKMFALTGAASSALITITLQGKLEDFSVTTATSLSDTAKPIRTSSGLPNTYTATADEVVSISPAGLAEVFDIQVDRTENFIANGLVSHNTRWHEDDPAGRLLPKGWAGESGPILCSDGHVWNVICLPAEADRSDDPLGRKLGEGLWPEWFGRGHWDEFKFPPRSWLSLYQQKPTSEQGTFFKREWFAPHRYEKAPEVLSIYMSADFAVTDGDGDYTEIAVWGVDHLDNVYVLDWYSGQETADVWTRAILDRVDRFKPLWFVGETGPIKRAVEPFLQTAMRDRRLFVACEWLPHGTANKEANARSFQALASVGRVHFPQTEAWAERVIDQLLRFPSGRYDDAVDACSLFGRQLERIWSGPRPQQKKPLNWEEVATTIQIADFEPSDGFRPYA